MTTIIVASLTFLDHKHEKNIPPPTSKNKKQTVTSN